MKYRTVKGDILDAICTEHYGLGAFDLAKVYAANMGLAQLGPVLPAGVMIELPEEARITSEPDMISLVD